MVAAGPGPRSAASGAGRASEQHDGSGGTQRASCGQHARTLPFFTEHPTTHLLERWHRRRAVDRGRRERIGESVGHDAQRIERCVEPSCGECVRYEKSGWLGRRRRRDPTSSERPRTTSRLIRQRVRALRPHAFAPSPGQSDDRRVRKSEIADQTVGHASACAASALRGAFSSRRAHVTRRAVRAERARSLADAESRFSRRARAVERCTRVAKSPAMAHDSKTPRKHAAR